MNKEVLNLFELQRQILGICPNSGQFFRLSDCRLFVRQRPARDWMDELEARDSRLDTREEKLREAEAEIRTRAREAGRRFAQRAIKKVDRVFAPNKLSADDAKVLFHPVDYIVFDKMNQPRPMKRVLLLDHQTRDRSRRSLQRSIEKVVEQEKYEWQTLRVKEDGNIVEE